MTPECAKRVAQILNLLDRRVVLGGSTGVSRRWGTSNWPQNAILRYSAARRSRNPSSAELHSAVSPICNRRAVRRDPPADPSEPSAEYNSAIQQITNLRYEKSSRRATTWTDTDRLEICATSRMRLQRKVAQVAKTFMDSSAGAVEHGINSLFVFCVPFGGHELKSTFSNPQSSRASAPLLSVFV